jgi:hypothetical protein
MKAAEEPLYDESKDYRVHDAPAYAKVVDVKS